MSHNSRISELRERAALLRRKAGVAGYVRQQQEARRTRGQLHKFAQSAFPPGHSTIKPNPPGKPSATSKVFDANQRLQNHRITRKPSTNEWVVLSLTSADDGYYTDDVDDAIATAFHMDNGEDAGEHLSRQTSRVSRSAIVICFEGRNAEQEADELVTYISADWRHGNMATYLDALGLTVSDIRVHDCRDHPLE